MNLCNCVVTVNVSLLSYEWSTRDGLSNWRRQRYKSVMSQVIFHMNLTVLTPKKIANHCVLPQLCDLGLMAISIQNYIFLNFMNQWYLVELHRWVISQPQSLYLRRIMQHRNTKTNIHAWSGIRIHDPINQVAKTYALDRVATGTRPLGSCYLKIPCLGPPFPALRLK
jgi:hypothetical protein